MRTALESDSTIDAATRSTFKYNSGIAEAFMLEAQSWIDNNENVLKFLAENFDSYSFKDPIFDFYENSQRLDFISLYKARKKANERIVRYAPFRVMVY